MAYFAGETVTDRIVLVDAAGDAITGATLAVVSALKPSGASFAPTIVETGGGVYSVAIATAIGEEGQWSLWLRHAGPPVQNFTGVYDVDAGGPVLPGIGSGGPQVAGAMTRPQLRQAVRERLEDTGSAPLWSDAALNEFLTEAVRAYGVAARQQLTAGAAVAAGVSAVTLPGYVPATGIVAVRDAHGRDVPRTGGASGAAPADAAGLIQAWAAWSGTLRLQRPAAGDEVGVWSIDYLGGRELVDDEVSAQPIEPGDEPIVIALAAAQAVERRAIEDAKRGVSAALPIGLAGVLRAEAGRGLAARKRRVRGGVVSVA